MNASVLVGIVPSFLFTSLGPKKTILLGGLLITVAHIIAAVVLNSGSMNKSTATALLFITGILGGQGACIIFFSAAGAALKQNSIICTSLVSKSLYGLLGGS